MKVIVKVRFRDLEEGRVIRKVDEVLDVTPERAVVLIGKGFVRALAKDVVAAEKSVDESSDESSDKNAAADVGEGAEKAPRRTKRN